MFDNIGEKIKKLAKVLCWIGIALNLISGTVSIIIGAVGWRMEYLIFVGIAVAIAGPIISWAGSFLLYGFGECIEHLACQTKQNESIIRLLQKEPDSTPTANTGLTKAESDNGVSSSSDSRWVCRSCGTSNSLFVLTCYQCGAERHQTSDSSFPKWECPTCGYINTGAAKLCYGCFAKKPQ